MPAAPQPRAAGTANRIFLALLALAVIGLAMWHARGLPENEVAWRTDFAAARAEARRAGKPLLLYFTADWCGPCRRMKREVWPVDEVERRVNAATIPVYLDVALRPAADVADRYGVRGIPTILLARPGGEPIDRITQRASVDALLRLVERARAATRSAAGPLGVGGVGGQGDDQLELDAGVER